MAKPIEILDITNKPDLVEVAESVHATGKPRILRPSDEEIAVITPIAAPIARPPRPPLMRRLEPKKLTGADHDAFFAAAGSWVDVETDTLIANIYADRRNSNRRRR